MKKLETLMNFIAFLGFSLIYGSVGGMEQDSITLSAGCILMIVGVVCMIPFVIRCLRYDEKDEERDYNSGEGDLHEDNQYDG